LTKPTGRPRGRPRKGEEKGIGKHFIEGVVLRKYRTALGAVQEIEKLLPKMSEADQAKVHLRLLELYTRVIPKTLQLDMPRIVFDMSNMIPKQETPVNAIDVTPQPPALPSSERLPVSSARDQALADAAQRERDRVESQEEQRRSPDIIEATNRRLAEEMKAEREAALDPFPPYRGGVKGC
jgi:hypothetical protein